MLAPGSGEESRGAMRRNSGTGPPAFRRLFASCAALALWLPALPAFAEVPNCLVVEARAAPSGNGKYDHSLTFTNDCNVRMYLTARYSDAPDSAPGSDLVHAGERITIILGFSQPTKAFRAHYDVRFGRIAEARSSNKPATGTVRSTASRSETPARSLGSSTPPDRGLPLVALCDRALRKLFKLQGLSDEDSKLRDRVVNCPSRVNRDPQKRRAELECVLGASTREDVRICFGAK
jgi:hypothetical protein